MGKKRKKEMTSMKRGKEKVGYEGKWRFVERERGKKGEGLKRKG